MWSVECTEHLFDKPAFFRRVAGWFVARRPRGDLRWQAATDSSTADAERQILRRLRGFFLAVNWEAAKTIAAGPSLTPDLRVDRYFDWTSRVSPNVEICDGRPASAGVPLLLAQFGGQGPIKCFERFRTILRASGQHDDLTLLGGDEARRSDGPTPPA